MRMAKASAYAQGRDYVLPDDISYVCRDVFCHRLLLHGTAGSREDADAVIRDVVASVPLPWTD